MCCYSIEQIYVCGGYDGTLRHTTMERYDPAMERWTLLPDMSESREGRFLHVQTSVAIYDNLTP